MSKDWDTFAVDVRRCEINDYKEKVEAFRANIEAFKLEAFKLTPEQRAIWGHDPVTKPSHYMLFDGDKEVIDLLRDRLTPDEFLGYMKGNMIKYLMRADRKNGIQDYKKLLRYVDMYVQEMED